MNRPKIYIIDDSLIFRAMLETMIADEPDFEICGVARSADAAREEIGWALPDMVLLDLNMPGTHGIDFIEELIEHWHVMNIIVISGDAKQGSDVCAEAFERGAAACFDKARVITSGRELIELMHSLRRKRSLDRHFVSQAISLPSVSYI